LNPIGRLGAAVLIYNYVKRGADSWRESVVGSLGEYYHLVDVYRLHHVGILQSGASEGSVSVMRHLQKGIEDCTPGVIVAADGWECHMIIVSSFNVPKYYHTNKMMSGDTNPFVGNTKQPRVVLTVVLCIS